MESEVLESWSNDCFILRLSKDNLSTGVFFYNVSLEADLSMMVEKDYKVLVDAEKMFNELKKNLSLLSAR